MSKNGKKTLSCLQRRLRKAVDTLKVQSRNFCASCVKPFRRNKTRRNACRKGEDDAAAKQNRGPEQHMLRRPAKTFHPFPRLPAELRLHIWSLAMPERVVSFAHPRTDWAQWRPLPREDVFGPPFVINTLKASFHNVSLLQVNREARAAAMWHLYGRGPPAPRARENDEEKMKIKERRSWGSSVKKQWDAETSPKLFSPTHDTAVIPLRDALLVKAFSQPKFAPIARARHVALLVDEPSLRQRCRWEREDPPPPGSMMRRRLHARLIVRLIAWLPGGEWRPPLRPLIWGDLPTQFHHLKRLETVTLVFRKHRLGSSSKQEARTMPGPRTRIAVYEPARWEREGVNPGGLLEDLISRGTSLEQFYGRVGPVLAVRGCPELIAMVSGGGVGFPPGAQLRFGKIEDPDAWKDEAWYRGMMALRVSVFICFRLPIYCMLAPYWTFQHCFGHL
ncbi:hypothetical protein ACRALDRAFT_2015520 [Sodiomyces alcalophilus JCM 7366]|uniref:uncharacterized protein n=1 Tax=Sodiomyces alcalophilus JCM 7366 TaxID=591952 RepID=UPI0039B6333C